MTLPHYTRSKALKFNISESNEAKPDDVPPSATYISYNRPPFTSIPVRPYVEAVREPESMSAEPVGPVPAPATPFPEDTPLSEGGPGSLGPAGSLYTGVTGPTPTVKHVRRH